MGDIDFEKHAREISPCGVIKLGDDEFPNKSQFGTRLLLSPTIVVYSNS